MISIGQILFRYRAYAASALGHVLPGHFEVNSARNSSLRCMDLEKLPHFAQDRIERTSLVSGRRLDGVSVHRVAGPDDFSALLFHCLDETRQVSADIVRPEAPNERQASLLILRVQSCHEALEIVRRHRRTALESDRVLDASRKFHVGSVGLPRSVADPDHVTGSSQRQAGR